MFWERVKSAFRETPFTMGVILTVLVVWLLDFFGLPQAMALLGGTLDLQHPWRVVTFPLAQPRVALWLLLGLYCFSLFSRPIERLLGSWGMARLYLVLTLLFAGVQWCTAAAALGGVPISVVLWGGAGPALGVFFVWASLHRELTILLMFVIPVVTKYAALGLLVLNFLSPAGPVHGLLTALVCAGCWKWAESLGSYRPVGGRSGGRLSRWWKERQRARKLNRFQLLEGGTPSAKGPTGSTLAVPDLQSVPSTATREDGPNETELDRILDKIRFEGMSSLTEAERSTLDGQSRRLRGDR